MPMDFHRYQSVADGQEALLTESSALSNCLLGRWSIIPPDTAPKPVGNKHMWFASFVFPTSHHPENDSAVIDSTLEEILLAEEIGMRSVWLTEHHFDGAAAHADPPVLGAAIAARTERIKIGFAVVELAFHHPIRLAVQTALLDNLSHGRLIVGTGRGSAYNHYEYLGFGITMEDGIARLDEAENLLVAAWTGEDMQHRGDHWDVEFPLLRPRPFQRPHPPLVR